MARVTRGAVILLGAVVFVAVLAVGTWYYLSERQSCRSLGLTAAGDACMYRLENRAVWFGVGLAAVVILTGAGVIALSRKRRPARRPAAR